MQLLADEYAANGLSLEAARRAAQVEIGGAEQVRAEVREARTGILLEQLWQACATGCGRAKLGSVWRWEHGADVMRMVVGHGARMAIGGLRLALWRFRADARDGVSVIRSKPHRPVDVLFCRGGCVRIHSDCLLCAVFACHTG